MSKIDWSKAPEGVTAFHPAGGGFVDHWVKVEAGKSWFCVTGFEAEGWKQDFYKCSQASLVPARANLSERAKQAALEEIVALIEGADAADKTIAQAIYDAGYRKVQS